MNGTVPVHGEPATQIRKAGFLHPGLQTCFDLLLYAAWRHTLDKVVVFLYGLGPLVAAMEDFPIGAMLLIALVLALVLLVRSPPSLEVFAKRLGPKPRTKSARKKRR